jgi:HEAT repeat protein
MRKPVRKDGRRRSGSSDYSAAIRFAQDDGQPILERVETIRFLGKRRVRGAVPALVHLLDQGLDEIRAASGWALEVIESRAATRSLIRIVRRHKSFVAREWALLVLHMLGDPRAELALTNLLNDKEESDYLRGRAAQALGMIHPASKRTAATLIRASSDPSGEVRYSAICALSAIQNPRDMAAAITALESLTLDPTELPNEGSVGKLATEILGVLRNRMLDRQATKKKQEFR